MKNILRVLTLLTISAPIAPISLHVATQLTHNNIDMNLQVVPKETTIKNITIKQSGADVILKTEVINLTALGIKESNDLSQYQTIELSGFKAQFLGTTTITSGSKWNAKMSETTSDWTEFSKHYAIYGNDIYIAKTERQYSLGYDKDGNYLLTLSYRFNCWATGGSAVPSNWVQAETGSIVKIY